MGRRRNDPAEDEWIRANYPHHKVEETAPAVRGTFRSPHQADHALRSRQRFSACTATPVP